VSKRFRVANALSSNGLYVGLPSPTLGPSRFLIEFLAQLAELFIRGDHNAFCVSVWMFARVEQIVTAAHNDLQSCSHRPTNEP